MLPPGRLSDLSEKLGRGEITRAPKAELIERFVDRAISFVERHRARPFYLQLWPDDVHDAYAPTPAKLAKFARYSDNKYKQQYFAVLDEMDRQIGRLIHRLDELALHEQTVIVFLSDNGPTAWPRYYQEKLDPPGSTAGLRGRKWSLYEGGIRTPLIVNWPGRVPAGRTNRTTVVSSVDFLPTFCRLTCVTPPRGLRPDGADMSAAFLGRPQQRRTDLFWDYGRQPQGFPHPGLADDKSPNLALRSGRWKLLMNADGSGVELYDFAASDRERDNVAGAKPRVAARMQKRLLEQRRGLPLEGPTPQAG
ncbi:MAG: hypothetical protein FJW31_02730 [Acidobacteria bacterium]|nr:hypothetical protein [Acidobacteriota bacterium]